MIDQNKKELIFDNILPREFGKNSKELDFHDQNELEKLLNGINKIRKEKYISKIF